MVIVVKKIGGRTHQFSREDVTRILESLDAEPLTGRKKLYIEYKGKKFPVKQVIAALTGLPRSAFATVEACDVLIRLGFEVKEWKGE